MIKRIVISNGKKYIVTTAGWNDDVGPGAPAGTLWMQSITDGLWYAVSLTGTSASAAIYVNPTPITWESPGQDFGYQLLLCPQNNSVYQTYLSGSGVNVTMSISQTPWTNPYDYKPYLWLQSDDGYFYAVYAKSGSIYLEVDQNTKTWMNSFGIPPAASPVVPSFINITLQSISALYTQASDQIGTIESGILALDAGWTGSYFLTASITSGTTDVVYMSASFPFGNTASIYFPFYISSSISGSYDFNLPDLYFDLPSSSLSYSVDGYHSWSTGSGIKTGGSPQVYVAFVLETSDFTPINSIESLSGYITTSGVIPSGSYHISLLQSVLDSPLYPISGSGFINITFTNP